jgi:hypothetical protein
MVIGLLRIGARICGLKLQRSKRETLSRIYYRMQFWYVTVLGVHQLQAKLQYSWMQTHFGGGLSQLFIHAIAWAYWDPKLTVMLTQAFPGTPRHIHLGGLSVSERSHSFSFSLAIGRLLQAFWLA